MAAATTATLSAGSYPKISVSQSFAGYGSRDSILNRLSGVHLRYKHLVAAAVNSSLQSTRIRMHSSNIGSQQFSLSTGDLWHKLNGLPRRHRSIITTRVYKGDTFKFSDPVITKKPEWWWRTLACVPYLIALQISDTGYFVQPFLEHYQMFENLIYFVPGPKNGFHPWFLLIYKYFGYKGIVKNKDWPHFIRYHAMMGMLLRTGLLLVRYTSKFFPFMQYDSMFGMHFWAAIVVCFIFVLLECVRCALAGKYAADIPFVSDAAYAHTRFNVVSFQSPC